MDRIGTNRMLHQWIHRVGGWELDFREPSEVISEVGPGIHRDEVVSPRLHRVAHVRSELLDVKVDAKEDQWPQHHGDDR